MFYANLEVLLGKLSCYVMNKRIVLDVQTMVDLFDMDGIPLWTLAKDYPKFNREEAVKLLFPNEKANMPYVKVLTTSLSIEDRLLHFTIVKCIIFRSTNTINMIEDELFLLWAFKKKIPLNLPFIILNYIRTFFTKI